MAWLDNEVLARRMSPWRGSKGAWRRSICNQPCPPRFFIGDVFGGDVATVIIGVDPHKGSHTALALNGDEQRLGQLRVKATPGQVQQLRRWAATWPERVW